MSSKPRRLVRRQSRNGSGANELALENSTTFLYADDLEEVRRMVGARGKSESEVIRDIVHDWVRLKKKKALTTEAAAGPEQLRNLLSEIVEEKLKPLREKQAAMGGGIGELLALVGGAKENFRGEKASGNGAGHAPLPDELLGLLTRLEHELAETRRNSAATLAELGEGMGTQLHQLARLLEGHQAQYTLLGQTFICNWTTLDFVVRFLVEETLRAENVGQEQIEADTTEDRVRLRGSGLQIIQSLEKQMKLPADLTLKLLNPLLPAPEGE